MERYPDYYELKSMEEKEIVMALAYQGVEKKVFEVRMTLYTSYNNFEQTIRVEAIHDVDAYDAALEIASDAGYRKAEIISVKEVCDG